MGEFGWACVDFMLFVGFGRLAIASVKTYMGHDLTKELLLSYLAVIGLSLSLTAVLFSYARVSEGKEKDSAIFAGRRIMNGAVLILLSFILNYYQMDIAKTESLPWLKILYNYTRLFAVTGTIIFALLSVFEYHRGFKKLIDSIFH